MIDEIVEYGDFIDGDASSISFAAITFKKDFGPWKKGQKIDSLTLQFCQLGEDNAPCPTLQEWSFDGDLIRECRVKLVPA